MKKRTLLLFDQIVFRFCLVWIVGWGLLFGNSFISDFGDPPVAGWGDWERFKNFLELWVMFSSGVCVPVTALRFILMPWRKSVLEQPD